MTRASCALRAWTIALFTALSAGGCFSDPSVAADCDPGMQGCACVELECEQGLTCQGGLCVGLDGTGSSTDALSTSSSSTEPKDPSTSTSSTSSSEASGNSTAESSSSSGSSSEGTPTTTTGEDLCGNSILDPGEECEGEAGCSKDCELVIHHCNPLNNVPCPETHKCSWAVYTEKPFAAYFTCQVLASEPLGVGEGDCFDGNDAQDRFCAPGLACYREDFLADCSSPGGCCTEYCDTTMGDGQCSVPADTCTSEPDLAAGLMNLGVCR